MEGEIPRACKGPVEAAIGPCGQIKSEQLKTVLVVINRLWFEPEGKGE